MLSNALYRAVLEHFLIPFLFYSARMFALKIPFTRSRKPANTADDPPNYPPFVQGLPPATPSRLLQDHKPLMDQIYQSVRASNQDYKKYYLPMMENYAALVHLLPASETHHHCGPGGLLRHGLEVAYWALQQCENAIYGLEEYPEVRRETTLKWELAVFTGGLCHDIGKCFTDMVVTNRNGDQIWRPFRASLYDWLKTNKIDRYFVRWNAGRHGRHEKISAQILDRVLLEETREYMAGPGSAPGPLEGMIGALFGSLSGGEENQVYTMINKADRASVDYDLKHNPRDSETVGNAGIAPAMTLIDAMRRLIKKGSWKVNCPGARLWFISSRLFLVWPQCATEITKLIESDGTPAIPKDPATMADTLFDRDYAVPYRKGEGLQLRRYWQIEPELLKKEGKQVTLMALEITNPTTLLELVPPTVEGKILDPDNEEPEDQQGDPAIDETSPMPVPIAEEYPIPAEEAPPVPQEPPPSQEDSQIQQTHESARKNKPKMNAGGQQPDEPPEKQPEVPKDLFKSSFAETEPVDLPLTSEPVLASSDEIEPQGQAIPTEAVADPNFFKANQSISGEVMESLAEDLKKGKWQWRVDAVLTENNLLAIRYPQLIGSYGMDAKDILAGLKEQDWLEVNPLTLMNNCMDVDNFLSSSGGGKLVSRKALVLTREATDSFLLLAGKALEDLHQLQDKKAESKQDKPTKKPEKAPKAENKDQPKKQKKRKPSDKKREQGAMMLAGGARIKGEGPPPDRGDLLKCMRALLQSNDLDIDWQDNKFGKYAPTEHVVVALIDGINKEGELQVNQSDVYGAVRELNPLVTFFSKNNVRQLRVNRERK